MRRSLLANESFDDVARHILQRREIEISQAMRSDEKMAEWDWDVGTRTRLPHPVPVGYLATESSNLHMEPSEGAPLPICTGWSRSSASEPANAKQSDWGSLSLTATGSFSGEHVTRAERVTHAEMIISFWHSQYA